MVNHKKKASTFCKHLSWPLSVFCALSGQASMAQHPDPPTDWSYVAKMQGKHSALGNRYLRAGKVELALKEFELAIKESPGIPEKYVDRATALIRLKDYRGVLRDTSRALELSRSDEDDTKDEVLRYNAHVFSALAFKGLGENDKAIIEFKRANEVSPLSLKSRQDLADLYVEKGKIDLALKELRICQQKISEYNNADELKDEYKKVAEKIRQLEKKTRK